MGSRLVAAALLHGKLRLWLVAIHSAPCLLCLLAAAAARQVMYNLPVDQMHAPVMGPAHHNQKSALAGALREGSGRAACSRCLL